MTEKLKYKVGDKVLVELEIDRVDDTDYPYRLIYTEIDECVTWMSESKLDRIAVHLPQKPKVTQAVMDYYLKHKDKNWSIEEYLNIRNTPDEIDDWLFFTEDNLKNQHALATLIAYGPEAVEVEKEKMYRVRIKDNLVVGDTLTKNPTSLMFTFSISDGSDNEIFTKNELEELGFGGVFDNPMFEVEEVD